MQEYKEKLIEINNLKQAKIAIKEEHKKYIKKLAENFKVAEESIQKEINTLNTSLEILD